MLCSIKMFEESERLHPVQEEETIKVEKIRGHIVFIGTEDDTFWNAAKYIRRMDERLKTHAHSCTYDVCVRPYGTHFCFPESMLKMMLPFGKKFALGCFFRSAKLHARECEQTRKDIDSVVERALSMW